MPVGGAPLGWPLGGGPMPVGGAPLGWPLGGGPIPVGGVPFGGLVPPCGGAPVG